MIIPLIMLILMIVGSLLLVKMYRIAHHDYLDKKDIIDSSFPMEDESFTIFFISDIHKRLINDETINAITRCDVVLIGGDLCEKGVSLLQVRENIQKLHRLKAPIYFVWGNNDYEINYHDLYALFLENDVVVLSDSSATLELNNGKIIRLVGLDCPTVKEVNPNAAFLGSQGEFTILIIHDPYSFSLLSEEQKENVNLVLSGHTHGGQIRILGWGLYPKGGWRRKNHINFLISEGYGTTKLPLRLGTKAECHQITIKKNGKNLYLRKKAT